MRRAREKRGWTIAIVAARLSLPRSVVEQWEQEKLFPSLAQWERLCRLFGIDREVVGEIFDGKVNREPTSGTFLFIPDGDGNLDRLLSLPDKSMAIYDPDLPRPSGSKLIGREGLLNEVKRGLDAGYKIGLHGLPGSGKTALAVALAHDRAIRARFEDGIIWAGFGRQPHLLGLFSRWGGLLGIDASTTETLKSMEAWITALRDILGQRKLLIIFDDVWQLEDVQACLIGGPDCAYILTTRSRTIAASFAGEGAIAVPELPGADGLALLAQFAPIVLNYEEETIQRLVRSVGGLPLALTLMGKYLRVQTADGRPRRLKTALDDLQDIVYRLYLSTPAAPSEHLATFPEDIPISLHSMIAVSDQQLDQASQRALRALSVLPAKPNAFEQEIALTVSGESIETLATLCSAGLLEQVTPRRYMLHQTIADYASVQLDTKEPHRRLVAYIQRFLAEHQSNEYALERELATIIVALEYAHEEGWQQEIVQCTRLIASLLALRGFYPLAEQVLQRAYRAAQQLKDNASIVEITFHLGSISQKRGEYAQARKLYDEGLALARQRCDQEQICQLLIGLGELAKEQGDYAPAGEFYQEGLILARHMQNREQICHLLISLGALARERGNYKQARDLYQEGLILARQLEDREQISAALRNLGVVASEQGDYSQAEAYYKEGLELAQQLEHRDLMSNILMNLGNLAKERGQYVQAETYLQESLALARQMGHQERISVILSNLGVLEDARSDYAQAEAYLREGLELARRVGHRERTSLILLNLGVVAGRQGNDAQAEQHYQEALKLARQLGHRERISLLLLNLGDNAVGQKNFAQAKAYLSEGMTLARQMGHQERISDLYLHLGILASGQEEDTRAEKYLSEGLQIARQINNPLLICSLLGAKGQLFLQRKQIEQAREAFQEMLDRAPLNSQKVVADAQYGLARVAVSTQEFGEAKRLAESSLSILNAIGHRSADSIRTFLESVPVQESIQ
ncbi:MAG: hypothetical protein NVS4B9_09240 [Ktedonobacteraceae bacterium]